MSAIYVDVNGGKKSAESLSSPDAWVAKFECVEPTDKVGKLVVKFRHLSFYSLKGLMRVLKKLIPCQFTLSDEYGHEYGLYTLKNVTDRLRDFEAVLDELAGDFETKTIAPEERPTGYYWTFDGMEWAVLYWWSEGDDAESGEWEQCPRSRTPYQDEDFDKIVGPLQPPSSTL